MYVIAYFGCVPAAPASKTEPQEINVVGPLFIFNIVNAINKLKKMLLILSGADRISPFSVFS